MLGPVLERAPNPIVVCGAASVRPKIFSYDALMREMRLYPQLYSAVNVWAELVAVKVIGLAVAPPDQLVKVQLP